MHIAAARPLGIRREDIPEEVVQREKEIYRAQAIEMGNRNRYWTRLSRAK